MFVNNQVRQRPHRKSRLGCKICKARRIKCDEARPVCGNCERRFPNPEEECEYEFKKASSSVVAGSNRTSSLSLGLDCHPVPSNNSATRSMDLRLFYHYATNTSHTMALPEVICAVNVWTKSIPSMAFDCPHVYNALLGVAATHLMSLMPHDTSLRAARYHYLSEAMSESRKELASINNENCLPLMVTSILLTNQVKPRVIYLSGSDEGYTPPISWFILFRGIREIGLFIRLWNMKDPDIRAYSSLNPDTDATIVPPDPPIVLPDDPLLRYWDNPSLSPERREIYAETLAHLEHIKSRLKAGEESHWIQRRLATMPGEVPKEFVGLLGEENPLALAILARYFALLKFVEGPWWVNGTAEFEIRGLAGLVGEDWDWSMEWPLQILEQGCDRISFEVVE